jgi:hypothetical protein
MWNIVQFFDGGADASGGCLSHGCSAIEDAADGGDGNISLTGDV